MTARWKRILAAAAALVTAGSMALGLALSTANVADPEPLNCRDWKVQAQRLQHSQRITYFVAVQDGYTVPAASSTRIIGDCAGGECVVDKCGEPISYSYSMSPLVNGWRLARVTSPRPFALAWKELAAEHAEVRFYQSYADVAAACLANFTPAQCRTLVGGVADCWLNTSDGTYCRYGLKYGPGLGGVDAAGLLVTCALTLNHVPIPCTDMGRGAAWAAQAHTEAWPADEDLDQ